jgi:uncharacterized membrane protein
MFPALPDWDGIHPAMVHFPVALLLAAPLLLFVSLFARQAWRSWAASALVVMALGTLAAWFAVGSGHAAGQLVDKVLGLERAVLRHEALGVTTRNLFTLMTLVFAAVVMLPAILKKPLPQPVRIVVHAVFLALYLGGTTVLAHTAHQGGRLVHEYGVRAIVDKAKPAVETPAAGAVGPGSAPAAGEAL